MCIEVPKSLNPQAEEWRPSQASLLSIPHVTFPIHTHQTVAAQLPPPQPAVPVVAYPAAMATYPGFMPYSACTQPQPYYLTTSLLVSFPAYGIFHEAVTPVSIGGNGTNNQQRVLKSHYNEDIVRGKGSNNPSFDFFKKPARRNFPPRQLRPIRSLYFEKKSQPKLDWRPRKVVKSDIEVSGEDRAVDSPQQPVTLPEGTPLIGKVFPHSRNTTVMIKNIPNQLRRDYMLKFLDGYCHAHCLEYDFLYLPMDFRKKDNLGYAFVNFTTAVAAVKFMDILQNFKWETVQTDKGSFPSKKICEITWARIQGKAELLRRFQQSTFACDQLDFLPIILDPPRNGSDPNPCPPVILGNILQRRPSPSSNHCKIISACGAVKQENSSAYGYFA